MTDEFAARPGDAAERALTLRKRYYVELAGHAAKLGCSISDARTIAEDAVTELVLRELRCGAELIVNERAWPCCGGSWPSSPARGPLSRWPELSS